MRHVPEPLFPHVPAVIINIVRYRDRISTDVRTNMAPRSAFYIKPMVRLQDPRRWQYGFQLPIRRIVPGLLGYSRGDRMDSAAVSLVRLHLRMSYEKSICIVLDSVLCTYSTVCMYGGGKLTLSKPQSPRTKPTGGDPAGLISTFQVF